MSPLFKSNNGNPSIGFSNSVIYEYDFSIFSSVRRLEFVLQSDHRALLLCNIPRTTATPRRINVAILLEYQLHITMKAAVAFVAAGVILGSAAPALAFVHGAGGVAASSQSR